MKKNTENSYQLLDSGNFLKLEQVGPFTLVRPSMQAVWKPRLPEAEWKKAQAFFKRDESGRGVWELHKDKKLPKQWQIDSYGLSFVLRLTDYGHIGIFPEHHGLEQLTRCITTYKQQGKEFRLLNLFAYTGFVSLMAAKAGAMVAHVDASKKSVDWAKENALASSIQNLPIRWLVDDVKSFVQREKRRGSIYQGIVLDPPSFGRGATGQVWKIEDDLSDFLELLSELMADDFAFFQLSSHSPGFTPLTLENLTKSFIKPQILKNAKLHSFEMTIAENAPSTRVLPSGACCILERVLA